VKISFRGKNVRFKKEIALLAVAIVLFVSSSLLYSYQTDNINQMPYAAGLDESLSAVPPFPYHLYAVSAIGFGSILMVIASISYQKRSKQPELTKQ
jgi:NADH:ubiquinone oxidoreductase subunit 3 (subunit A)